MAIIRAKLSQILPKLKTQLVQTLQLDPTHVHIDVPGTDPGYEPQDFHVKIIPRPQVCLQLHRHGGGRTDTRVVRRVAVEVKTRLALDEAGDSEQWLTHALGHLDHEHAVIDALELFVPKQGDDWLVYQPLKLVPTSDPQRPDPEKSEWGKSVSEWDVCFVLALDQSRQ